MALGSIVGSYIGFPLLDPLGGILVAGMILKSGFEIMLQSLKELVDVRVEQDVINQVEKAVEKLKVMYQSWLKKIYIYIFYNYVLIFE